MNMCCAKKVGEREREIYGRPFTTVRLMPSNTDEEIAVLIADLTQPDEEIYGVPSNTDEEIVVLIADLTQPDEAWS